MSSGISSASEYSAAQRAEILALIERICSDEVLSSNSKSCELLRYLVEQEMLGKGEEIDSLRIARDVLGRGPDFDPARSSVVRVQMFRLRRLIEDYNREHRGSPQILIPARRYRPVFSFEDDAIGSGEQKRKSARNTKPGGRNSSGTPPGKGSAEADGQRPVGASADKFPASESKKFLDGALIRGGALLYAEGPQQPGADQGEAHTPQSEAKKAAQQRNTAKRAEEGEVPGRGSDASLGETQPGAGVTDRAGGPHKRSASPNPTAHGPSHLAIGQPDEHDQAASSARPAPDKEGKRIEICSHARAAETIPIRLVPVVASSVRQDKADPSSSGRKRWRLTGRLPLVSAIALVLVLVAGITLWAAGYRIGAAKPMKQLAPTVMIRIPPGDAQAPLLDDIGDKLVLQMQWSEMPISFRRLGNVDYIIEIKSEKYSDSSHKVLVSAYRADGEMIGKKVYNLEGPPLGKNADQIAVQIFENFADSRAIIPNDVRYSDVYPEERRELYGCYVDALDFQVGLLPDYTSPADVFHCLDPDLVADPKEKSMILVERASIMSIALVGDTDLGETYTNEDVLAEIEKAEKVYDVPLRNLGQIIVNEWKNPARTDHSLRALVNKAEGVSPDIVSKYIISVSYTYFLDDMEKARPYTEDILEAIDNGHTPARNTWNLAPLPELMFDGDYETARKYLSLSEGPGYPTAKLLDLVLSCYLNDSEPQLETKAASLNEHLREAGTSLKGMIKRRRYSARLERELLAAFETPQCVRFADM